MHDWNDLRYVLALYRARTFAGAARTLSVDATTAGRRLAALEERLGTRLFDRTPDGLRPTVEAAQVLETAEAVEQMLSRLEREVGGADERAEGMVTLTSGETLAQYFLIPRLPEFHARHPDVEIDLRPEARTLDLTRREADVALRMFRPQGDALVTRKLCETDSGLYASADYLARRGTPGCIEALDGHDFLGFAPPLDSTREMQWLSELRGSTRFCFRSSSARALVGACRAGLGIGHFSGYVGRVHAELRPVLAGAVTAPARQIWLTMHPDVHRARRVRVLVDFLVEIFARDRAFLGDRTGD